MPNDPESAIVSLVILFPFFLGLDNGATKISMLPKFQHQCRTRQTLPNITKFVLWCYCFHLISSLSLTCLEKCPPMGSAFSVENRGPMSHTSADASLYNGTVNSHLLFASASCHGVNVEVTVTLTVKELLD